MFVATMSFFSCNALNTIPLSAIPLKFVSLNNHECRIRPEMININPKKAGLFEGSFSWRGGGAILPPPSVIFQEELI